MDDYVGHGGMALYLMSHSSGQENRANISNRPRADLRIQHAQWSWFSYIVALLCEFSSIFSHLFCKLWSAEVLTTADRVYNTSGANKRLCCRFWNRDL